MGEMTIEHDDIDEIPGSAYPNPRDVLRKAFTDATTAVRNGTPDGALRELALGEIACAWRRAIERLN
jgi:hypothetical protein